MLRKVSTTTTSIVGDGSNSSKVEQYNSNHIEESKVEVDGNNETIAMD